MIYLVPQNYKCIYKCIKCKHEFIFSPHDPHPAPTTSAQDPVCPRCWDEFVAGIGIGYCTTAWTTDGSAYERQIKEKNT
jgi:DNA-directed RNA polymerase subunit RPC12/RpoP